MVLVFASAGMPHHPAHQLASWHLVGQQNLADVRALVASAGAPAAASAIGSTRSMTGRELPGARSAARRAAQAAATTAAFSAGGRARSVVEQTVARLGISRPRSSSRLRPALHADDTTSRPSVASASMFRARYGPPMLSRMTSAPRPSVEVQHRRPRSPGRCSRSPRRRRARGSAPASPAEPAVQPPARRAPCPAGSRCVPIPLAPPCTSSVSPGCRWALRKTLA